MSDVLDDVVKPTSVNTPVIGYLHEVDIVRLLTFASVIGVHAVAQAATGNNVALNSVEVVLHFTRDAFFALTGFVLFHTNYRRPLNKTQFWKRRFPVVLVPYVVWSTIYFAFWLNNHNDVTGVEAVRRYGYNLLTGSAQYHLYFLLVSMQIYALFPVLRWVVMKTAGYHVWLFGGLLLTDGAFTAWQHFAIHNGNVQLFANNSQELVTTYLVFVFGGAIAAVHLNQFQAWVRSHLWLIGGGLAATLAVAQIVYGYEVKHNESASFAADTLQPTIMAWSIFVVLGLYWLGLQWSQHRQPGRTADIVTEASRASFGVYLVHPLMLSLAANLGFSWNSSIPSVVSAIAAWLIAVVLSAVFVEVFIRTPLAMPLTGRSRDQ